MLNPDEYEKFKKLSFEGFKELAKDEKLSVYEKIGFPDAYRKGKEGLIFLDILEKLPKLREEKKRVLDIGIGCSEGQERTSY